ncbi:MAG TPA: dihydrofolate reductase family protein [Chitinophaga sp.]|uniref:dihydrofolate reductase family protein n=1 Tax=Chitinophaga sp. TaxID=1869181 RepID=UPI002CAF9EDA|nr:dihydrofolate reductase family protein [Chitinophaga sp.]HVI43481.1 dihydrofolate reductase family protein [Chitinophaga sp.]
MRKVIVSMNVTLDGFISGPDNELDWHFESWTPDMGERLTKELSMTDTILLGRNTYEAMAQYWPGRATDLLCPRDDVAYAVMMNRHYKAVYSKTLKIARWNNSRLIKGNLNDEIKQLKQFRHEQEKDIIVYGSGRLVATLIELNLIDEYQLWIHPVLLGKGKPLFRELKERREMRLIQSKSFKSGVVLLHYAALRVAE